MQVLAWCHLESNKKGPQKYVTRPNLAQHSSYMYITGSTARTNSNQNRHRHPFQWTPFGTETLVPALRRIVSPTSSRPGMTISTANKGIECAVGAKLDCPVYTSGFCLDGGTFLCQLCSRCAASSRAAEKRTPGHSSRPPVSTQDSV
jgi:hypothetical protein